MIPPYEIEEYDDRMVIYSMYSSHSVTHYFNEINAKFTFWSKQKINFEN
jgi:hypothetical protein